MNQWQKGHRAIAILVLLAIAPSLIATLAFATERDAELFSGYRSYAAKGEGIEAMMHDLVRSLGDAIVCSLTQEVSISRIDSLDRRKLDSLKIAKGDPRAEDPYIEGIKGYFTAYSPSLESYEVFYIESGKEHARALHEAALRHNVSLLALDRSLDGGMDLRCLAVLLITTILFCIAERDSRSIAFALGGALLYSPLVAWADPLAMAASILLVIAQRRIYRALIPLIDEKILHEKTLICHDTLRAFFQAARASSLCIALALIASFAASLVPHFVLLLPALLGPISLRSLSIWARWRKAERRPFAAVPLSMPNMPEVGASTALIGIAAVCASFYIGIADEGATQIGSRAELSGMIVPSAGEENAASPLPGLEEYKRHRDFQETLGFARFLDAGLEVSSYRVLDGVLVDIVPANKVQKSKDALASHESGTPLLEKMLGRQAKDAKPAMASIDVALKVRHASLQSLIAAIAAIFLLLAPMFVRVLVSFLTKWKTHWINRKWKERLRQL